jgi:3-phosphoshikimate 1-carboxyvinyltransferase
MKIKTIENGNSWIVNAPPSKSFTNRALIISALADGVSTLKNPIFCDDTKYMIQALEMFGVKIERNEKQIKVFGTRGKLKAPKESIYAGNAGTAFRFLASLAVLADGKVTIDGDERMRQRPIEDLLKALRQLVVKAESTNGYPPVTIDGQDFIGGMAKINSSVSSQFLSSLMMIAPFAKKPIELALIGNPTSKPYLDITMEVMKRFGVKVKNYDYQKFIISNNSKYKSVNYFIEGDASNASYFMAAAAITHSTIRINGIDPETVQGDIKFLSVLEEMGCEIYTGEDNVEITGGPLQPIDVNMNEIPDLVPTLAVIMLFTKGKNYIRNVANLRYKECDRLTALTNELRKIGATVEEMKSGLMISSNLLKPASINTYNDHRMAMSFSIAGLKIDGIEIENPECVNKSFPDYWNVFNKTFY